MSRKILGFPKLNHNPPTVKYYTNVLIQMCNIDETGITPWSPNDTDVDPLEQCLWNLWELLDALDNESDSRTLN
jgi:hypothetical protein